LLSDLKASVCKEERRAKERRSHGIRGGKETFARCGVGGHRDRRERATTEKLKRNTARKTVRRRSEQDRTGRGKE